MATLFKLRQNNISKKVWSTDSEIGWEHDISEQ